MRVDLHLVSPYDELSLRNGSAVLTVARQLRAAAIALGYESWVGGGSNMMRGLEGSLGVFNPPSRSETLALKLADAASKYFAGRSLLVPDFAEFDLEPSDVYCHNSPWIVDATRERFPRAKTHLYAHNLLMKGASSRYIRRTLANCDSVICVSNYVREDLIQRGRLGELEASRVRVVHNGVDARPFKAPSNIQDKPLYDICYVGRVVPEKGVKTLVDALRYLKLNRRPRLLLVGGKSFLPGDKSRFERRIDKLLRKLNVEIARTGPVEPHRVPAAMNSSSLVVVPSVWDDPCPLVFLEALASKASVIATESGGMPELGPRGAIRFVPKNDPMALASAIQEELTHPESAAHRAHAQQAWAELQSWPAVYQKLIEHWSPPR